MTAFRQVVAGHGCLLARTTGTEGTARPRGFEVGGPVITAEGFLYWAA